MFIIFPGVMIQWYIGTSGWSYSWNKGNSLNWYLNQTGANAIELNMSFYRFPLTNIVKSWNAKSETLSWVVKVHRSITHHRQLTKDSIEIFHRFKQIFIPLEPKIRYYLLQLPPKFTDIDAVERFIDAVGSEKLAVEFRHPTLFTESIKKWGKNQGVVVVSVDAPHLPNTLSGNDILYIRLHGRDTWYDYNYTYEELHEIFTRIIHNTPKKVFLFFNNYEMLPNLQYFQTLL